MATMTRTRSGRFAKRSGGGAKALTRTRTRTITKYRTRRAPSTGRRARRRSRSGGGLSLGKVILAGVGIGWLTSSQSSPLPKAREFFATKVPGGKTFGPAATAGAAALLVDKFMWRSPWLRAAGFVGLAAAALKLGEQNTGFKFLGGVEGVHGEDDFVADVDEY